MKNDRNKYLKGSILILGGIMLMGLHDRMGDLAVLVPYIIGIGIGYILGLYKSK